MIFCLEEGDQRVLARGLPEALIKMADPDRTAFIQTMGRQQARQLHIFPTKTTFRNLASTWSTGSSHQNGPARPHCLHTDHR
jgi:hypothetical protein